MIFPKTSKLENAVWWIKLAYIPKCKIMKSTAVPLIFSDREQRNVLSQWIKVRATNVFEN